MRSDDTGSTNGGAVAIDTFDKHHGIALWPTPSSDPRDPLRWRKRVKIMAMLAVSLSNFVANVAGAGFSVAVPVLIAQFQKSPSEVNALLTVCLIHSRLPCIGGGTRLTRDAVLSVQLPAPRSG